MTLLDRRNPTVKVVLLCAVSLATLFLFDISVLATLWGLGVVGALATTSIGVRRLALAHLPFLAFGVGLVAANAVTRPGPTLVTVLGMDVTRVGLAVGLALALRGLLIGVVTVAFLASTPPRELMVSLTRHAHLSPRYAYALLAAHRMLAATPRRWATIRAAQAVRGPGSSLPDAGRAVVTLLVGAIRGAERTALALESRGLGAGPRSVWRVVPLTWADGVLAAVVVGTAWAVLAFA
jgi:energy-coupling factor transporter transmembrane protein EcfT